MSRKAMIDAAAAAAPHVARSDVEAIVGAAWQAAPADLIWLDDDPELSLDLWDLADWIDPGEVTCIRRAADLPKRWVAHVVVERDEDGDAEETEIREFASENEAIAAAAEDVSA
ncbi:MAG: hypothetical protein AAFR04_11625 [Pseudomonadota bacterium]